MEKKIKNFLNCPLFLQFSCHIYIVRQVHGATGTKKIKPPKRAESDGAFMENAKAMTAKELTKKISNYLKKWHPGHDWKVIVKSDYDNYIQESRYDCYIRTEKEKVSIDKGKYAVDGTSAPTLIEALQSMYELQNGQLLSMRLFKSCRRRF